MFLKQKTSTLDKCAKNYTIDIHTGRLGISKMTVFSILKKQGYGRSRLEHFEYECIAMGN